MAFDYDLFVIGGGSGGVRAARMAAGRGLKVALAEEDRMGGTCVIRGCVPKKLLVTASLGFSDMASYEAGFGFALDGALRNDWPTLIGKVRHEVRRLEGIYENLLANAGVTRVFKARAKLIGPNAVEVGGEQVTAGTILIATGGRAFVPPSIPGAEFGLISDHMFELDARPERIAIYGAGYIAVEFAGIFEGLGSRVDLIHRVPVPLRSFDADLRDFYVQQQAQHKGLHHHPGKELSRVEKQPDGSLRILLNDGTELESDALLLATGRKPNTEGLGLETVGVALDHDGHIAVDPYGQTSVDSVYAVGDVSNRWALTPMALAEAMAFLATRFDDNPTTVEDLVVPTAIFSNPELATLGLRESEARKLHAKGRIYRANFKPLKHTLTGKDERIFVKLVTVGEEDKVVGIHLGGHGVGEMLQGFAVAVRAGATKAHFDRTLGIHPTSAEELVTLRESADAWGWDD